MIILSAVIFTAVLTWPFVVKLGTYYSDYGDYPLNASIIWYNQDALLSGKLFNQRQYFNGYQAYPHPLSLTYSNLSFIPGVIFAPFYLSLRNYVLAINMFTFFTFVFTFISAFYCLDYVLKRKGMTAIVGALVFTFNPQTLARFPEHLDLLNKYFLPPLFLFAYLFLEKPTRKRALLFGLFFCLNGLSVNYYLILSTIVLVFLGTPFFIFQIRKKNLDYFLNLAKSGFVILLFVPIMWYFIGPYIELSLKEGAYRTVDQTIYLSSTVLDWLSSSPNNALYGSLVKGYEKMRNPKNENDPYNNYQEHSLFLNVVPAFLFLYFAYAFFRNKQKIKQYFKRPALWFVLLLLFVPFALSFGPYFLGWNNSTSKIPLPYLLLYKMLPIMQGLRAPTRFQFIFYVPFSLFVAHGTSVLLKRFKKYQVLIFLIIITAIIAENYNYKNFDTRSHILPKVTRLKARNELSFLEGKSALHYPIFMPENFGLESNYLSWATQTKEHIVNSNTGYIAHDQLEFMTQMRGDLDEKQLTKLVALGVDYAIIHRDLLTKEQNRKLQQHERLYMDWAVFAEDGILVLDLKKYDSGLVQCNFPDDFTIAFATAFVEETRQPTRLIRLSNTKDCYLASPFEERYREIEVSINAEPKKVRIKLPMLIEPNQQIVLSEVNKEVKME